MASETKACEGAGMCVSSHYPCACRVNLALRLLTLVEIGIYPEQYVTMQGGRYWRVDMGSKFVRADTLPEAVTAAEQAIAAAEASEAPAERAGEGE